MELERRPEKERRREFERRRELQRRAELESRLHFERPEDFARPMDFERRLEFERQLEWDRRAESRRYGDSKEPTSIVWMLSDLLSLIKDFVQYGNRCVQHHEIADRDRESISSKTIAVIRDLTFELFSAVIRFAISMDRRN
jgi:hypothetical protein